MGKNVFITRTIPGPGIDMLREKGYEVFVNPKEDVPTREEIIDALKQKPYDAVISLLTDRIDSLVFDSAPTVKLFANYAIGYDNIDIAEAKKRGVFVTNTPGMHATAIAEHALSLILGLTTRMVEADKFVREGKYNGWSPMRFIGTDLTGKTIGIIGTGRIGGELARILFGGFKAKIVYADVVRNENIEKEYKAKYLSIEEVLKVSDIVSIHVPLADSTKHLINEERLKMMKPTSFLINTSRGPVVDENALYEALKDGTIRGAGLDVFEFEPNITQGLLAMPNVVLTPHIASARETARDEMSQTAAENVIDFFEGRTPRNIVNS